MSNIIIALFQSFIIVMGTVLVIYFLISLFKKRKYFNKEKKGLDYEEKVKKHYELQNYQVEHRGKELGFKDGGIDLIATNENEIILIQCKNWDINHKYKIREKEIREFYGACHFYIDLNINQDIEKDIICKYIIPNNQLITIGANKIFKKHYKKCRYEVI